MTRVLSMSMIAAMLALGLSSGAASAHERNRCDWITKCHWHHGHKVCEKIKVCHDRDHDHRR